MDKQAPTVPSTKPIAIALAGELVTTAEQARRIWRMAIARNHTWLIPQAERAMRRLRAAGQDRPVSSASLDRMMGRVNSAIAKGTGTPAEA